jgi:hypothetical protein
MVGMTTIAPHFVAVAARTQSSRTRRHAESLSPIRSILIDSASRRVLNASVSQKIFHRARERNFRSNSRVIDACEPTAQPRARAFANFHDVQKTL